MVATLKMMVYRLEINPPPLEAPDSDISNEIIVVGITKI